MNFLKNLFAGKGSEIIESVGEVADKFITTKHEKDQFNAEVQEKLNAHIAVMEQEATKQLEAQMRDMDSARNREVVIATAEKSPLINKIVTPILALGLIALTFTMFYMVLFKDMKGVEKDIVIYILGVLSAITTQVCSYYFGSSIGSKTSSDTIRKMLEK